MSLLSARVVLVTGAGSGIGAGVCRAFADAGDLVVATDLAEPKVQAVVEGLPAPLSGAHRALRMDVSAEDEVIATHRTVEEEIGPVAVLVTAAGLYPPSGDRPAIAGTSLADWIRTEQTNAQGTFLPVREMLKARAARPVEYGRILTFTSIGAQVGVVRANVGYAASKAAVMGLTRCAAREGAAAGITANCIAPGFVRTPMLKAAFTDEALEELARSVPVGRLGTVEEVAALALFLASPLAGYITGTTIDINGGSRIGT